MVWIAAAAAEAPQAPLSAINWLGTQSPKSQPVALPQGTLLEPPVTQSGDAPEIKVAPLGSGMRRRLGLVPRAVSGFGPELWVGSDPALLERRLQAAMSQRLAAAQELLVTLLLAEADDLPQERAATRFTAARLDALHDLGAVDPALALVQQSGPERDPALFARWFTLGLLSHGAQAPCLAMQDRPNLAPSEAARIYCLARTGAFDTAALLYGTAAALDVFDDVTEALLAHYLDPDLFAETPLPPPPARPDALTFRLYEAAGEPLSTTPLPRAFAVTDLSETAGWKAQLEAAERLTRAGVLPSNQLLGLYSNRKPAASGGIWDRVAALQAFEQALSARDVDQVAMSLPPMWRGIQAGGLEVAFSELFATQLAAIPLEGPAAAIAFRMGLLSRNYETTRLPATPTSQDRFLSSLAVGLPNADWAETEAAQVVAAAFSRDATTSDFVDPARPDQLGETLLTVLVDLSLAGLGDLAALRQALTDLRALGLEDIARRSALQYLILRDRG